MEEKRLSERLKDKVDEAQNISNSIQELIINYNECTEKRGHMLLEVVLPNNSYEEVYIPIAMREDIVKYILTKFNDKLYRIKKEINEIIDEEAADV